MFMQIGEGNEGVAAFRNEDGRVVLQIVDHDGSHGRAMTTEQAIELAGILLVAAVGHEIHTAQAVRELAKRLAQRQGST